MIVVDQNAITFLAADFPKVPGGRGNPLIGRRGIPTLNYHEVPINATN